MDIALASMLLSQSQTMTSINTALLSKSLDTATVSSDNMIKMMEQSVNPNLGQSVDLEL
jgi:hypothetical protein